MQSKMGSMLFVYYRAGCVNTSNRALGGYGLYICICCGEYRGHQILLAIKYYSLEHELQNLGSHRPWMLSSRPCHEHHGKLKVLKGG